MQVYLILVEWNKFPKVVSGKKRTDSFRSNILFVEDVKPERSRKMETAY